MLLFCLLGEQLFIYSFYSTSSISGLWEMGVIIIQFLKE